MTPLWDDQFETVLRSALPLLPADEALTADTCLRDQGLDSMATIDTLMRLEEAYQVTFPDEALNSETFATPGSLWTVLADLRSVVAS